MENPSYDVFISYRQREPEKSWVRQTLLPRLTEAGLRVLIDFKHFRLGAPLITEMERAVKQSRYTVIVATPAYFESSFTEFENLLAQHLGLEEAQHRLLLIMRETVELTLRLNYKLWLPMTTDEEFEENLPRLVEALKEPAKV
jgi:hypothetical protein